MFEGTTLVRLHAPRMGKIRDGVKPVPTWLIRTGFTPSLINLPAFSIAKAFGPRLNSDVARNPNVEHTSGL